MKSTGVYAGLVPRSAVAQEAIREGAREAARLLGGFIAYLREETERERLAGQAPPPPGTTTRFVIAAIGDDEREIIDAEFEEDD